jgi:dual oxidase maturation factor 1
VVGLTISAVDLVFPHHFSTILEVDYDTAYDRHVIIEESTHRGRKKKSGSVSTVGSPTTKAPNAGLEEPPGVGQWGSKLLR